MQVVYSGCTASGVYNVMKCVHNNVTSVSKKRPDWEDVKSTLESECLHNRRLSTPRPPLGLTIEGWDSLLSLTPGLKVNSQLVVSIWLVAINIQLDSVYMLQMGVYKQNFLHSSIPPLWLTTAIWSYWHHGNNMMHSTTPNGQHTYMIQKLQFAIKCIFFVYFAKCPINREYFEVAND